MKLEISFITSGHVSEKNLQGITEASYGMQQQEESVTELDVVTKPIITLFSHLHTEVKSKISSCFRGFRSPLVGKGECNWNLIKQNKARVASWTIENTNPKRRCKEYRCRWLCALQYIKSDLLQGVLNYKADQVSEKTSASYCWEHEE